MVRKSKKNILNDESFINYLIFRLSLINTIYEYILRHTMVGDIKNTKENWRKFFNQESKFQNYCKSAIKAYRINKNSINMDSINKESSNNIINIVKYYIKNVKSLKSCLARIYRSQSGTNFKEEYLLLAFEKNKILRMRNQLISLYPNLMQKPYANLNLLKVHRIMPVPKANEFFPKGRFTLICDIDLEKLSKQLNLILPSSISKKKHTKIQLLYKPKKLEKDLLPYNERFWGYQKFKTTIRLDRIINILENLYFKNFILYGSHNK